MKRAITILQTAILALIIGAGAVYAENQALRWIADLAGLPARAGGVFVSGGTIGNLSALVAARHALEIGGTLEAVARGTLAEIERKKFEHDGKK